MGGEAGQPGGFPGELRAAVHRAVVPGRWVAGRAAISGWHPEARARRKMAAAGAAPLSALHYPDAR